jgi:hypothetical protein
MNGKLAIGIVLTALGLLGTLALMLTPSLYLRGGYEVEYCSMMGPSMIGQPIKQTPESSISLDQAKRLAEQYLDSLGVEDLAVKEIMEFERNFYIVFYERKTGAGAFEALIWKTGSSIGRITPEPGPNMMWNTKYGGPMVHMGGWLNRRPNPLPSNYMPIDEDEARRIGQKYLDEYFPGAEIKETTQFYGYYTFDFGRGDKIHGMFSVNGYSGQVWYHSWHGSFIRMEEYEGNHG